MKSVKENKLLSKRVNFPSVGAVLDEWVPRIVSHFKLTEQQEGELRGALTSIFEHFLFHALYAAKLGAEKGIAEAFELFKDADYHEVVKRRRAAERERMKGNREASAVASAEWERRHKFPTREEKLVDIKRAVSTMAYHRQTYHSNRAMILKYVGEDGPELLADFIKDELDMPDLGLLSFDIDAYIRTLSEADIDKQPRAKTNDEPSNDFMDFFDTNAVFEDEE